MVSGFMIVYNEEEMLPYSLECWRSINDQLDVLSIVDNGSTDATMDIIHSYMDKLPIVLTVEQSHRHHGRLRDLALSKCNPGWVLYLDADETWDLDFPTWLSGTAKEECDQWEFYKYSTTGDRGHTVEGGNGPSRRLFRYRLGVGFPQSIHTEPQGPGLFRLGGYGTGGPYLFDHTGCKSREALWAKGWRYQWARGVPGIGPSDEYIQRVDDSYQRATITPIPEHVMRRVFTGPT